MPLKPSDDIKTKAELTKMPLAQQYSDPIRAELAGRIALLESTVTQILVHLDKV